MLRVVYFLLILGLAVAGDANVNVNAEGSKTCHANAAVADDGTCSDMHGTDNDNNGRAPPQMLTNGTLRPIDPSSFQPIENVNHDPLLDGTIKIGTADDTNTNTNTKADANTNASTKPNITMASIPEGEGISLHYVQNFLSADTVSKFISMCNQRSGWTNSPQSIDGSASVNKATRTSSSCPLIWPQLYLPIWTDPTHPKHSRLEPLKDEIELTWHLTQRVASFLNISEEHVEPFQIVRYEPGQLYREHHDHGSYYGANTEQRPYTLLLFLSDMPTDKGGYTKFRALNEDGDGVSIVPRMGDGVLWRNEDELTGELLMDAVHEAVPPVHGHGHGHDDETENANVNVNANAVVKYAMNVWIAKDKIMENMDVSAYRTK